MEPYSPDPGLGPLIGNSQTNNFQDLPLNVCVADAVSAFGLYINYIVLAETENQESSSMEEVTVTKSRRNAFDVSWLCVYILCVFSCVYGYHVRVCACSKCVCVTD